ncbi:hypothetical protein [Pontiella agarivorans]|uniref:Uncharacterized protein n=1 Tax=Pontiella agarivorans TaxID=3038953 RepID=A0ABU5N1F2_9BACT|nr:hypothetical protein [Pontiella agarivorans]MDZ8120260.1 hypothetical protein [Pontiella agarivorans]
MAGTIGAIWGIFGLSIILGRGLFSIWPFVDEIIGTRFSAVEWIGLAVSLVFMGYAEGYKGFHLKFSPRVAARALYLKNNPTLIRILFAPLFCMGFFHATKKRKIVAYSITTMVIVLILSVRYLAQPWRGIVDAGVLFGLGWGLLSVWMFCFRAFFGKEDYTASPETPDC